MSLWFQGIFLLFLFILSAFFSALETALFSLSKIDRRRLREDRPPLAHWVFYHLEHPRRTLTTLLIGNMLVNTLAASLATLLAVDIFGTRHVGRVVSLFTLFFIFGCEIMPKTFAVRNNLKVCLFSALPLQAFATLVTPLRYLLRRLSERILVLFIRDRIENPDLISEKELKALVRIGEEEGVFDRDERRMMQKLFELGERPVRVIMTPRTDVVALDIHADASQHRETIKKYHFSYFPVYEDNLDHIVGVIQVYDYLLNDHGDLRQFLTQPLFIPETKRIDDLLEDFRREKREFAVCVDEYGGTAGIVTLEDILEEIFGEFYDEYAKVEQPIRALGRDEFLVDAKIPLEDFNEFFSCRWTSTEAATLGGFLLEKLGEVPQKGKVVLVGDFEIKIHDVIRYRIRQVRVKRKR